MIDLAIAIVLFGFLVYFGLSNVARGLASVGVAILAQKAKFIVAEEKAAAKSE